MIHVEQSVRVSSIALGKNVVIHEGAQAALVPVPGSHTTVHLTERELLAWAQFYADIAAGIETAGTVSPPKEVTA